MKVIYNKAISRKGNIVGKAISNRIEKCSDCNFVYKPIKSYACGITHTQIKDINSIPKWCPLEDYNAINHRRSAVKQK